jgi:hypothetical protein
MPRKRRAGIPQGTLSQRLIFEKGAKMKTHAARAICALIALGTFCDFGHSAERTSKEPRSSGDAISARDSQRQSSQLFGAPQAGRRFRSKTDGTPRNRHLPLVAADEAIAEAGNGTSDSRVQSAFLIQDPAEAARPSTSTRRASHEQWNLAQMHVDDDPTKLESPLLQSGDAATAHQAIDTIPLDAHTVPTFDAPQYEYSSAQAQPYTLSAMLQDDFDYHRQACEQESCEQMWACAGGRHLTLFPRLRRNWRRSYGVMGVGNCGGRPGAILCGLFVEPCLGYGFFGHGSVAGVGGVSGGGCLGGACQLQRGRGMSAEMLWSGSCTERSCDCGRCGGQTTFVGQTRPGCSCTACSR